MIAGEIFWASIKVQRFSFAQLQTFATIAQTGSFARAAVALGVSSSALSQTMRALEDRIGVKLLTRTARGASTTDAGARLLEELAPALAEITAALSATRGLQSSPSGTLRLCADWVATDTLIRPILHSFLDKFPEITIDLAIDDGNYNLAERAMDAGIRQRWAIGRDMVATRITPDFRMLIVASPEYLAKHGRPVQPQDLAAHRCLAFMRTGAAVRWSLQKGTEKVDLAPSTSLSTNSRALLLQAALQGSGLSYLEEYLVAPLLAQGQLVPVLEDWAQRRDGYFVFYPSRRQVATALKAFLEFIKDTPLSHAAQLTRAEHERQ